MELSDSLICMNMKLIDKYDARLKQSCPLFDFDKGYSLPNGEHFLAVDLYNTLKETMITNKGIGLSAPQIGIMTQAFVFGDPTSDIAIFSVFNPKIVDYSDDTEIYEEGCLSFPGLYVPIRRARKIRARFTDHVGTTDTIYLDGLSSRIFQHEYDHMNGTLYKTRATLYHLDFAKQQMKKLNRLRKRNENRRNKTR